MTQRPPALAAPGDDAVVDLAPAPAQRDELDVAFARFLRLDVANGDASVDTIRGYL
jgi:hypothetical protein